jgi:hypothetical protein
VLWVAYVNTFAYFFSLKDLLDLLTSAQQALYATNQMIERLSFKSSLLTLALTKEEYLGKVWYRKGRKVNRALLYSIYDSQQPFPIKAGINRRNELIGHLNIMTVNLYQKLKENIFNNSLYYSTEEDLFNALLRVFHSKLFESPVFRKVSSLVILDLQ